MHERKAIMAGMADALVTLPGGFGTLEELFEMVTWNQIGIHDKPIFLLNTMGFYNPLLKFIEHTVTQGFVRRGQESLMRTAEKSDRTYTFDQNGDGRTGNLPGTQTLTL